MHSSHYESIPARIALAFPDLAATYEREVEAYAPGGVPPTVFVEDEFIPYLVTQVGNQTTFDRCLAFLGELAESTEEATLNLLGTSVAEPLLDQPTVLEKVVKGATPGLREILIRIRDWPS
jgi:hypothetical protein